MRTKPPCTNYKLVRVRNGQDSPVP